MENKENFNLNVLLSFVSFGCSILSVFVMYYVFAGISLVTGLVSINDEKSKKMSITSLIIVFITFVVKIVNVMLQNGNLPNWLMNGII